jgi:hypothetical protein
MNTDTKLLQIKVKNNTLNDIDTLQKSFHASGRSDTVRRSIDIASALASAVKKGDKIIVESKDGERKQIIITGLKSE